MATTFVDYTGDGNATKSFSFPSIKEADIKVKVDDVLKTVSTHYNITSYTTTGGGNVVFTSGNIPTSPADIHIYRDTDVDSAKATYTAGSSVKAGDLNNNQTQLLYALQEEQNQPVRVGKIKDDAVTTAKIKDDNVTLAKLGSGALPTDITVASANLVDGTIVNADVNASAAIAGTKVAPDFGSQNVVTTGTAATGALTVTGTIAVSSTVDGRDVAADGTKLDTIETSATADQTNAEIRTAVEAASDSNVFTDADHSKLNAIEAGATADQTNAEIKTAYEANADTNEFSDAEQTKLAGIETAATADQTNAEIRAAVEAATDSNVFTDADHSKLNAIEASATADQTNAEIKTAYEANADTNEFSDAEQSKLAGIETAATIDQTAAEIKTLLQSDKLTISEINTTSTDGRYFTETELTNGALDGRYYTETEAEAKFLRQDSSETIASGVTWSNSDAHVATTAAINARIVDLIDDVGGFTAITSEQHFPNTNPQGSTGQAAILSIQAASTTLTPSGTTVTISNGNLANNANITITGVSAAIPTGFGFLVESTSTLHTYSFHRLVPKATEVTTVATNITNIVAAGTNVADINNFADIYQIAGSAPSQRADGGSLTVGDLWFDSSNDNLTVWNGSSFATITPSQSVLDDVAIVSGAITYSEDLGLITASATTGSSNGSLDIVADVLEDEITFTVTASGGAYFIDGVSKPALTLYKGWTYTFDLSSNTLGSHPLRFSSGGSAYNTGVTVTGTQGSAGAKVQLVVPESQPTSFIYYCTNHSNMGNSITVKDDPLKTVSDNVTNIVAVANNSTNINAVNTNSSNINSAVSNASNINSAVSNASNINSVVSNATNINTVAGSISNVNSVGGSISNVNSVHSNATNINSAVSNATNINTVAGSITNVNSVASNMANVNNFTEKYQIASSDPSTDGGSNALSAGDLYFNTSANELKVYTGSAWQGGVTATGNFATTTGNTFTGDNIYNDNVKAKFGTGSDLQIFHTGTQSHIRDAGTGGLLIQGSQVNIQNTDGSENMASFINNGAANLFYNNVKRLETTNTGATITGLMTATTIDGAAGDNLQLDFGTLS